MSTDLMKDIGSRVRSERNKQNLSQNELAEKVDLHPVYISMIENGKKNISAEVLKKLCEALDISSDWILQLDNKLTSSHQVLELEELLSDCTPKERNAILRIATEVKAALRAARSEE